MTTVATDGKTIAADRQGGGAYKWVLQEAKIWRVESWPNLPSPFLIGCAGSMDARYRLYDWLSGTVEERPTMPADNFEAISLHRDGSIYYWDTNLRPFPVSSPHAIGSGAQFAMGAMLAGANAREAVEIACQLDSTSGCGQDVFERP